MLRVCDEMRQELMRSVARTGGHLASNLGTVELTVALHACLTFEKDRLVFDVGHQCYTHKMLTGRADQMDTLRQLGGLSGFPKPYESRHRRLYRGPRLQLGVGGTGHGPGPDTAGRGLPGRRSDRRWSPDRRIGLRGPLSDAGDSGEKLLVILNDNGMSIRKNVGGIATLLARQHLGEGYLKFKRG